MTLNESFLYWKRPLRPRMKFFFTWKGLIDLDWKILLTEKASKTLNEFFLAWKKVPKTLNEIFLDWKRPLRPWMKNVLNWKRLPWPWMKFLLIGRGLIDLEWNFSSLEKASLTSNEIFLYWKMASQSKPAHVDSTFHPTINSIIYFLCRIR